ncbi:MAG: FAD-dependent oxidoreductase [Mycolicibacterium insubricum]|nr:FAD-dependent oxidoreductase [Mycobacterium sp.]
MARTTTFIIVGAGLAGVKGAEALRDNGFDGRILLLGSEEQLPYERPPLSKDFLAGKTTLGEFTVVDAAWFRDHHVDVLPGAEVTGVDRHKQAITTADGTAFSYDKLLLATGSRSRRPDLPGAQADGVHYLRTVGESEALRAALTEGARLGIVGGGWIGLEVAAVARERGVAVTVVESARLPLLGALGPQIAAVFADLHRAHGVDLRTDTGVTEITTRDGRATGLLLDDGTTVDTDAVLVAVGATPNIELADHAGLELAEGGVLVNASLCTGDPRIYAVGDIAAAWHPLLETRIRTEHWANALKQPAVAAAGMLGRDAVYDELPYFFTDQYDLGMEYVGHSAGYQRVVTRGDMAAREFTAFWLDGADRVLAGMNVNIWDGLDDIKALIRAMRPVDADELADDHRALADL